MGSVLVTGASTGIGEACAIGLDRTGHKVFAGVRRQADGDRLRENASPRLEPVLLDVTDPEQITAVVGHIDQSVGGSGLSGLVNNAGVAVGGPLEFLPLEEWRTQFEVNVFGQISVTQALIPMLRRGTGRVVFIGSLSGRVSTPLMGPYGASKHAIEAIGESLREELRPWGMHVAVVEPGAIRTPIWDKGRSTADQLERTMPAAARQLYGEGFDRIRGLIDQQERDGIPPERVATAVEHALFARRPRYRYLVGTDAQVAGNLKRFLPDKVMATLVAKLAP
jgi:NAD(P)-dependent dehydrogenase (short-subunit alcohol dehydrogenase family)